MPNHVYLEPLAMKYLDSILRWVNDKEVVGDFAGFDRVISREEEESFLEELINSEKDSVFAIHEPNSQYIGNIGLHDIGYGNKSGRLAIIIGEKEYWGKGYAQQAIKNILSIAFNKLGLRKVWLKCLDFDEKVKHLYEKCGFKEEEVLKNEYFLRERHFDMIRMSQCA